MHTRHYQRLVLAWLLLSAVLTVFLFAFSQSVIQDAVKHEVKQHLIQALDESLFSNAQNRVNDHKALQKLGQQISATMNRMVTSRWYSSQKDCAVRLQRIDDVVIDENAMNDRVLLALPRNQIEREVVVGFSCSPNWIIAAGVSGIIGLFFVLLSFALSPPLSKVHLQWVRYLLERGYGETEAFEIVRRYDASRLTLNPSQLFCLEHLHDSDVRNFASVLELVTDDRVATLNEDEIEWFNLGLGGNTVNLDEAWALVCAEDTVEIDLQEMTLTIHGLRVAISRTPLFYLAWYAMNRVGGDGWITNPASNRPDVTVGQELARLMSEFDGHAKAINDLEQSGLKARTLDQNRSKIKDDIVAALGEKLAATYLFESGKHQDGVRMKYRLQIDSSQIKIIR